jgi:hypothetical protein
MATSSDIQSEFPDPQLEYGGFIARVSINHTTLLASASSTDYVVDSGATHHMVHSKSNLANIRPLSKPVHITVGNGETISAEVVGNLAFRHITLKDVLYVPNLGRNLLSVGVLQRNAGTSWAFREDKAELLVGGKVVLNAPYKNGLFLLDEASTLPLAAHIANASNSILADWHRRLGHLNVSLNSVTNN